MVDRYGSTDVNAPSTTAIDLGTSQMVILFFAILDNGDDNGDGTIMVSWVMVEATPTPNGPKDINLGTGYPVAVAAYNPHLILDNGDLNLVMGNWAWATMYTLTHPRRRNERNTVVEEPSTLAPSLTTATLKCWGMDATMVVVPTTNTHPVGCRNQFWDNNIVVIGKHTLTASRYEHLGSTISGTPSVYALNQTYTIYANQISTTHKSILTDEQCIRWLRIRPSIQLASILRLTTERK